MIELVLDQSVVERWSGNSILVVCGLENMAHVPETLPALDQEIEATISDIRAEGKAILESPGVRRMRATFKAMPDMDPSRYRPSSEALVRRCLEKDIFRINPVVDCNNLLSMQLLIPLGIYDSDLIQQSTWTYRIGLAGESYSSISNQPKNASGKLVVSDDLGIIGSPVADSGRASIRPETRNIVVIAYLPFDTGEEEAERVSESILKKFVKYFEPAGSYWGIVTRP